MKRIAVFIVGLLLIIALGWAIRRSGDPLGNRLPAGPQQAASSPTSRASHHSGSENFAATNAMPSPSLLPGAATTPLPRLFELLSAVQAEGDPGKRSELLRQLLASVSTDQIRPLLDHLLASPGSKDMQGDLIRVWAEQSPKEAAVWASSLESPQERTAALQMVATSWTDKDLSGALAWLKDLPTGAHHDQIAGAISYEAAGTDPLTALRIATELPGGQQRDELAIRAIREWSAKDPSAAATWSLGITDAALREKAVGEAAIAWSAKDPPAAATFATSHLPADETLSRVAIEIAQRWAATTPANAAAWAATFPEGDLRNTALRQIISVWAGSNPSEVAAWIGQQPAGDVQNRSFAEYAEAVGDSNPASAIPIALRIADEPLRQAKLEVIAARWLDSDPAAARSWIKASALTPVAKGRLLTHRTASPNNP